MSDTLCRGFCRLVRDFVALADSAGELSGALVSLESLVKSKTGSPAFRDLVGKALAGEK